MKFLIKAEATQSIGFGHIKRQINLARAFEKRGIEVIFAVKEQNALTRRVSYEV